MKENTEINNFKWVKINTNLNEFLQDAPGVFYHNACVRVFQVFTCLIKHAAKPCGGNFYLKYWY